MNDSDLLRRFVVEHSQDTFAELVRRRIGLVYSAALRQVGGDAHHAEDVTQEVFIDLARKTGSLRRHPALIDWLYTSTHFAAAKLIRTEQRRARREQEAHARNDSTAVPASPPVCDSGGVKPLAQFDSGLSTTTSTSNHSALCKPRGDFPSSLSGFGFGNSFSPAYLDGIECSASAMLLNQRGALKKIPQIEFFRHEVPI